MRPKLSPAVAKIRVAVRGWVTSLEPQAGPLVVALSGGADSLALTSAVLFEAQKRGFKVHAVTVDHRLQNGSCSVAQRATAQAADMGADRALVLQVSVANDGAGGLEAAARDARYAALLEYCAQVGAQRLFVGHTLNDQAEQVLMALARGSGTRALSAIAPQRGLIVRPLLTVSRQDTERACRAENISYWRDPQNADPRFLRARVRHELLPVMSEVLGARLPDALARTAELARADADALDAIAVAEYARIARHERVVCGNETPRGEWAMRDRKTVRNEKIAGAAAPAREEKTVRGGQIVLDEPCIALRAQALVELPQALRTRVIRIAGQEISGCALTMLHTSAIAELVTNWRGQQRVEAPNLRVWRASGELIFVPHKI
ncbi:tRNA lysidine(34) synthetase TilS [Canibacter sp. lx-45]|uniref:tRNA lysidine(34) synthetase TilS n=1 Tax=Canibacter zhuwentaonis TaxID=2837491 RepID=UPI001BDD8580|nr:tRNA lysidine(34) synthetase TilS [Canibacter zhuwentaonis]